MKKIFVVINLILFCGISADRIDYTNSISPRDLSVDSIIFGEADASYTTSIIGLHLNRVSDLSARLVTSTVAKLVLQDSNLVLDGDYSFTYSSLQIVGDVNISGCGNTFKFFGNQLLISPGSTLSLSDDITFDYTPSSSSDRAIVFQDCDSTLLLDNSTLNIDNGELTGLRLYNGKLKISGDSTISLASTSTSNALFLGGTPGGDTRLQMLSNSVLNITGGKVVSQNNDATSFKIADNALINGDFLFKGVTNSSSSVQAFDLLRRTCNFDTSKLSNFTLPGSVTSLSTNALDRESVADGVNSVNAAKWSPNGKYLAVGTSGNAGGDLGNQEIIVLEFSNDSLTILATANSPGNTTINSIAWSPDSRHIIVGRGASGSQADELSIYLFENNSLTLIDGANTGAAGAMEFVDWSSDGRFVFGFARGPTPGGDFGSSELVVFEFSGLELVIRASTNTTSISSGTPEGAKFSPDGNFIALGTSVDAGSDPELLLYHFNDSSLSLVDSIDIGTSMRNLDWSPDGRYLVASTSDSPNKVKLYQLNGSSLTEVASLEPPFSNSFDSVKFSPDGRFIALGGSSSLNDTLLIAEFTGSSLVTTTYQNNPLTVSEVDWSPDGKYLAVADDGAFNGDGGGISVFAVNYESTTVNNNVKNIGMNPDAIHKNETVIKSL